MFPENETGKTADVTAVGEHATVRRDRFRLALYAACGAAGLGCGLYGGQTYDYAVQSFHLLTNATRLLDVANTPTPVRNLLGIRPELAPLCPQPEVQTPEAGGTNKFPIRTRLLKRLRRAPT